MNRQSGAANILGVGFSVPENSFSQDEVARILNVDSDRGKRFFSHPHIQKRHLSLPRLTPAEKPLDFESTGELLARFKINAIKLSVEAVGRCLRQTSVSIEDIDMICCVTSTGFLVPGLSSLLALELKLKSNCQRLDIVGMGCNAGLNGLSAVTSWCAAHPDQKALLICCEVCSAIYSMDPSEESALVNSLFGDGAVASIVTHSSGKKPAGLTARVVGFETNLIPDSTDLLRFDWDPDKHRFRFVVDRKTPAFMATHALKPVQNLLKKFGLAKDQISHWIIHSGGEAILSGIEKNLQLKPRDLRHTRSVLNDFGNISSGSFLVSYDRLLNEKIVLPGEFGVMMTMGPGLTIETALVQWEFST